MSRRIGVSVSPQRRPQRRSDEAAYMKAECALHEHFARFGGCVRPRPGGSSWIGRRSPPKPGRGARCACRPSRPTGDRAVWPNGTRSRSSAAENRRVRPDDSSFTVNPRRSTQRDRPDAMHPACGCSVAGTGAFQVVSALPDHTAIHRPGDGPGHGSGWRAASAAAWWAAAVASGGGAVLRCRAGGGVPSGGGARAGGRGVDRGGRGPRGR
jgi:hypothetical protein